jgi:hypothetical protein
VGPTVVVEIGKRGGGDSLTTIRIFYTQQALSLSSRGIYLFCNLIIEVVSNSRLNSEKWLDESE